MFFLILNIKMNLQKWLTTFQNWTKANQAWKHLLTWRLKYKFSFPYFKFSLGPICVNRLKMYLIVFFLTLEQGRKQAKQQIMSIKPINLLLVYYFYFLDIDSEEIRFYSLKSEWDKEISNLKFLYDLQKNKTLSRSFN